MAASWIPAAASALGSVASSFFNYKSNMDSTILNQDNAKEILKLEQDYNNFLLGNQKQLSMDDAKKAGVNPAFAQGSVMGSSSSSPSVSAGTAIPTDFSGIGNGFNAMAQLLMQEPVLEANTRLTNAKAEEQELLNADKKSKNRVLANEFPEYQDENGNAIPDLDKWLSTRDDKTKLPSILTIPMQGAEGRYDAKQSVERWKREVSEINYNKVHFELLRLVEDLQLRDKDVVNALYDMPLRTWTKLCEDVEGVIQSNANAKKQGLILDLEKSQRELEKQITEDSNVNQYIEKIFSKDFEIKDLAKLLVMSFLGTINNLSPLSSAYNNFKGKK